MTSPQPKPFRLGRTLARIIAWLVAVVVVLIAVLVVFILTFDWNHAKPYVNEKVTEAIGRPFAIEGDLKVGWQRPPGETGWRAWVPWPRFSATQIEIANPDWTKSPHFATLDEIDFEVAVLPLLAHDIVIPAINLVNPSIDVERLVDGRNNWTFKLPASSGPSTWRLDLHDITFSSGNIDVSDQQTKTDVKIAVSLLGHGIPIGKVMEEQEAASRQGSAQVIGRAGANRLTQQVQKEQASEAAAASAASEASGAAASGVPAAASVAGTTTGTAAATSAPTAASQTLAASGASSAIVGSGVAPAQPPMKQPFYAIGWTIKGTYGKTALSGDGKLGGVLALQDAKRPFPIQADMRAGDMHIALVGTLTDPMHLAAVDLRLWLQGQSLAHLYNLTGVTLPETPPYATDGHFVGNFKPGASVFRYENFTGRVGGSDLNGTVVYQQRTPRPLLSGELVSNLLQFSDLAPIIGADSKASKNQRGDAVTQPADRVIPVEQFRTDRWNAIDADVKFTGRRIIKQGSLPVQDLYTHVTMTNGVLVLDPLQFGVAGGTLGTRLNLDGNAAPLKARGTLEVRHLKLKQLFPNVKTMQSALGEINGDASLTATGNSPAALASTSNGEVKLLVTQGTISMLLMEAAGLNVANVVYEKLFGSRDVKINCAAADFVATNGVLDPRVFALDTDDAVIDIDGPIDLRDESMDMKVHPHTKGFRIFTLRSPLYVKGTFKNPRVGVDATALALRGGAMIGLGLINPFAALIPLIAPSNNKPLPCDTLFAQMHQHPVAPPPGQKMHALPKPDLGSAGAGASAPTATDKGDKGDKSAKAGPATRNAPSPASAGKPTQGQEPLYKGS
ncbi:AsmA family protein [Paraburkholderia sp. CNPSo 3274]|uniref:AsmA family protein n=1 Tax=Paraburkholderia sp. CNPSo 3274 TaxID=2940932 RepID=UPI0020B73708|nr:AsmA family protein [Paraburkholderia sp. CNPSo 3274]MCP3709047.1 AsmA family protein [Paraburkholderia sp. CNPSo 3274]